MKPLTAPFTVGVIRLDDGPTIRTLISVPAGGGYGGPMLYFLIQAMGVFLEGRCGLKQRWIWRLRAWLFLVGPLPLLFHRPFVNNVMVPFFKTLGVIA